MSDEPRAACAHLRVAYKPIDNGDGSMRERWQCEACGHTFTPYRGGHNVPGLPARHMIVRDACRDTHGDQGAVSEALAAIESEARKIIGAWPKGQGHQFHFVLTVERDALGDDSEPHVERAVIPALCAWPTCRALATITHVMVRADGHGGGVENVPLCDEHSEAIIVKGLVGIPRDPRVGDPGVRDPDAPCEHYEPGEPEGTPHDCDGDGHYLCERCKAWNGGRP